MMCLVYTLIINDTTSALYYRSEKTDATVITGGVIDILPLWKKPDNYSSLFTVTLSGSDIVINGKLNETLNLQPGRYDFNISAASNFKIFDSFNTNKQEKGKTDNLNTDIYYIEITETTPTLYYFSNNTLGGVIDLHPFFN